MGWLIAGGVLLGLVLLGVIFRKPLQRSWREAEETRARQEWPKHREQLQRDYFELARRQGKPRGLRWVRCDWLDEVEFLRLPDNQLLTALVSVNLHFEAIEGGDMEDVEAVSTVRDATALFHYQHGTWGTGGRTLFNMNAPTAAKRLIPDPSAYPSPFFNDP